MKRSTYSLRSLLALVLVLAMIGTMFVGCSKTGDDETVPPTDDTTTQTTPVTDPTEEPTEEPTEAPTEPEETAPPAVFGIVNTANLNVRAEPYNTADILKRLNINTRIEILEQKILDGLKWGRIVDGWVNMTYVTIDDGTIELPPVDTTVENDNNIGSGSVTTPSTGTTTKPGTSTGSSSGSSSGSNNTVVSNGKTIILGYGTVKGATTLAIRTGPSTNYAMVSYLSLDEVVPYYQMSGNWVRVKRGWVSSKYLELESAVAIGSVGKVNAYELNIRKDADADSKAVGTYKEGDSVTILDVKGNWGKVEYATGKTGWINLNYVTFSFIGSSHIAGKGTVTADYLNVRKTADHTSTSLTVLKKNTSVTILAVDGHWGEIEYATGKTGWINLNYVVMDQVYTTGVGKVTASSLNVRDAASTKGKDIGSLSRGDKVTILEVKGNWGKIAYDSGYGWISLNYVEMDTTTKYTVTIGTLTNGKVEASTTSCRQGSIVTLTVTPNTGYALDKLTVDGKEVTVTGGKYTFTMPAANVTVSATFKAVAPTYTVTISSAITNGKVTASSTTCAEGTQVVLTAVPKAGYVLKDDTLTVMNTTTNLPVTVTSGRFTMPAGNVNVVAEFVEATTTYSITVNTVTGGTVKPSTTSAEEGDIITLTAEASTGYVVDAAPSVKDAANNPVDVDGSDGNYSFKMPAANVTVVGSFKEAEYTVNVTQPSITGCSLSVNPTSYKKDANVTVTVTEATGHKLDKLTYVEEGKTTPVEITNKSFKMPASNVTVSATFKKIDYKIEYATMTNGSVSAKVASTDVTTAQVDDTVTLEVKPSSGYVLDGDLTVKNASDQIVPVTAAGTNTYTFTMPASKVTVTAAFKTAPVTAYNINITNGTGGSVTAAIGSTAVTTAKASEQVTLTVSADSGYELDKLTVGGSAVTVSGGKYTFTMPAADVAVNVTFKLIPTYNINITNGTGGSVSGPTAAVKAGESVTLTVTADSGYELDKLTVAGTEVSLTDGKYTFNMPSADVAVNATFKAIVTYKVKVTALRSVGGTTTPVSGVSFAIKDQNNDMEILANAKSTGTDGTITFSTSDFKKAIAAGMKLVADCDVSLYDFDNHNPVRTVNVKSGSLTATPNSTVRLHEYALVGAAGSFEIEYIVYVK